ncbi:MULTISPECIES: hypothetical protein [unclassified Duganella]|uniref:hypothetical protein n=1 Tax=unclassified Duganella TaxID=2636909 RepID=UPI0008820679|nr:MULTISPECIES: hypothetical protein [unclassified Duganella]SDF80237.1 hypothetical protein SAMN05216320_1011369 [Duganella sp. OV458]SDI48953.1 hypothetical protein SAMN05428973_10146 [Duganella sp. OV510]
MSNHETLAAALLAAFNLDADKADPAVVAGAAAGVLVALQEPLLTELRKQTTLLEVLAKQGDRALHVGINGTAYGITSAAATVATGAAASGLPG